MNVFVINIRNRTIFTMLLVKIIVLVANLMHWHFSYNQLFYCLGRDYNKTGPNFAHKLLVLTHVTFYDKSESTEQTIKALQANQSTFGYRIKSLDERLIHENKSYLCEVSQGRVNNFLMYSNKFSLTHFMPLASFYTP